MRPGWTEERAGLWTWTGGGRRVAQLEVEPCWVLWWVADPTGRELGKGEVPILEDELALAWSAAPTRRATRGFQAGRVVQRQTVPRWMPRVSATSGIGVPVAWRRAARRCWVVRDIAASLIK